MNSHSKLKYEAGWRIPTVGGSDMKKTLLGCTALVALAAVSQFALAADKPTYSAAFAKAPITMDGVLDGQWATAAKVSMTPTDATIAELGHVWGTPEAAGDFRVMWDAKYIYWGFSINDAQINVDADDGGFWQRDCASGFLFSEEKEINIKFFTAPKVPGYTMTGPLGAGVEVNSDALTGYKLTKAGYDVEIALPWASFSNSAGKAGDTMAFTALIIDQNDAQAQYMWVGDGDNADNFATLKLVK